ncbi:hypothetical protein BGW36DRAFT_410925 [Talaromyces proteolyticus]|uniref:Integral membrane protein n=1 Tax=Talaromyces proteolyticus TaxID=1131652 RepID=A0AAD4PVB8_9EURO|nr:uncharacterized protein BGW36DRAFT_410925 [Talaromyces proteolyticus]KAH8691178.1 hypothetical protein BGW36DRAFT_410925 [Talaromyces proteolyticus]
MLISHGITLPYATILKRISRVPAFRALLFSALLYLLAFQYCRIRYWRDPHSAFFDITNVYDWEYSLVREHEANHFISFHKTNDGLRPEDTVMGSNDPLICAAFVTVKRERDDYFEQSIGSMLEGLDVRERRALHLRVLFANTDPAIHPSWEQSWMNTAIDLVESYNVSESSFRHLQQLESDRNFQEKGVLCVSHNPNFRFFFLKTPILTALSDYVYVLDRCLTTNAPFIGIFEDDIIFADGWMTKTLKALIDLNPSYGPSRDQSPFESTTLESSWLYLRLFYTETLMLWGENDFAYRNIHMVFAAAIAIGFLSLFFARRLVPGLQLDYGTIAVICLVTIPAFTGLYFMIGKYSIHPLRGLVPMDSGGCCSQALIYSRQHASQLMEYLQEQRSGQTDLMIEDFAAKTNLRRFALAPQQLQHIGIRSSRGAPEVNAQSTWAFWFEENDAKKLKSEHEHYLADEKIERLLQMYE